MVQVEYRIKSPDGKYSEDIPSEIARQLVIEPKHFAFDVPENKFWLYYDDHNTLHYGVKALEGKILLSERGRTAHSETFGPLEHV